MTIFLCYGDLDECQNCGGSATLGGTQNPTEDGRGGRFCCVGCMDEAHEANERRAAAHRRQFACCPSCGYDNSEDAPECAPHEWRIIADHPNSAHPVTLYVTPYERLATQEWLATERVRSTLGPGDSDLYNHRLQVRTEGGDWTDVARA